MDVISRLMRFIAKKKQQNRLFKEMATIQSLSNQIKKLYQDIRTTFAHLQKTHDPSLDVYEKVEKNHGRIERRRVMTTDDLHEIRQRDAWENLQSIGMILDERQRGAKMQRRVRY